MRIMEKFIIGRKRVGVNIDHELAVVWVSSSEIHHCTCPVSVQRAGLENKSSKVQFPETNFTMDDSTFYPSGLTRRGE